MLFLEPGGRQNHEDIVSQSLDVALKTTLQGLSTFTRKRPRPPQTVVYVSSLVDNQQEKRGGCPSYLWLIDCLSVCLSVCLSNWLCLSTVTCGLWMGVEKYLPFDECLVLFFLMVSLALSVCVYLSVSSVFQWIPYETMILKQLLLYSHCLSSAFCRKCTRLMINF